MEVAIVSKKSLRIKGKTASLGIDPDEGQEANAALVLTEPVENIRPDKFQVVLSGPGDYETGGIKTSAVKGLSSVVYVSVVDSITITVGILTDLEKLQSKLKEANIVIAYCDIQSDASFLSAISTNVVLLYGDMAEAIGNSLAGESVKKAQKYTNTIDKLPAEIETVILK